MDKLLLMGVSNDTLEALAYCKQNGVYTVVTDYIPYEKSMEKQMADEYWMIDLKDIDALEKKCREDGITGVYAGNSEFCLDQTKQLAQRLGLPFYSTDEAWKVTRNKAYFMEKCKAVGLDTPRVYHIEDFASEEGIDHANYPLVVKPADSSAGRGFSIVRCPGELRPALKKALDFSPSKELVIEDYISGEEFETIFYVVDGKPTLVAVCDMLKTDIYGKPGFFVTHNGCKSRQFYLECVHSKVIDLMREVNCQNGFVFVQMIHSNGKCYMLEFANRIEGVGLWEAMDKSFGFNPVKYHVDYAL